MDNNKPNYYLIIPVVIIAILFVTMSQIAKNTEHTSPDISESKNVQPVEYTKPSYIGEQDKIVGYKGACNYLDNVGLFTNEYKNIDGFGYVCHSTYKLLDSNSNIAYYAEGDENNVNKVYIVLNLYKTSDKKMMNDAFLQASQLLTEKATNTPMTAEIKDAISTFKAGGRQINNDLFELKLNEWSTGLGYDYKFSITKIPN